MNDDDDDLPRLPAPRRPPLILQTNPQLSRPPGYGNAPSSLSVLRTALGFVANGQAVEKEFLIDLRRQLTSMQERFEIVNVVLKHHQAHRLQKLLDAVELHEQILFDPNNLLAMEPDQQIKLYGMLMAEVKAVTEFLAEVPTGVATEAQMEQVVNPQKVKELQDAKQTVTGVSSKVRAKIREVLERTIRDATSKPSSKPSA